MPRGRERARRTTASCGCAPTTGTPRLINRALVAAGVAVTELRRDERQLEDVFFEMTDHATVSQEIEHV